MFKERSKLKGIESRFGWRKLFFPLMQADEGIIAVTKVQTQRYEIYRRGAELRNSS